MIMRHIKQISCFGMLLCGAFSVIAAPSANDGASGIKAQIAAERKGSANWRDDMWKSPVRIRDGVTLRAYAHEKPRLMKVYVAKIDLATPGIGFTTTERASDWGKRIVGTTNPVYHVETKRETTADFMLRRRAEGRNVEIAFNTTPWRPWPMPKGCESCDLLGWCVADGVELSSHTNPTERKEALFVIGKDGRCAITEPLFRAVPSAKA